MLSLPNGSLPSKPLSDSCLELTLYVDGLCQPKNPSGWACWAWIALEAGGQPIAQEYGCLGHGEGMSNHLAEAKAVLYALQWAHRHGLSHFTLYTDSQVIVNQALGRWAVHAAHLKPILWDIRTLLMAMQTRIVWIPRAANRCADALSLRAYQEARWGQGVAS
jgi:ribonuclease HI